MDDGGKLRHFDGMAEVAANVTTNYLCPPHFHDTYAVAVFHGPVRIWCRNMYWTLNPGQLVVLEPREVHSGTSDSRYCAQDAFEVDPRLLTELFGSEQPARFSSPVVSDSELADRFSAVAASGNVDGLRAAIFDLFVRHAIYDRPVVANPTADEVLRSEYVAALASQEVECSRVAGLSRSHFSRRVRALLGLSPRDFRRQIRVIAARALIESGGELSDCALKAGFADQAHMTRQMRSLTGVTPGFLRREVARQQEGRKRAS